MGIYYYNMFRVFVPSEARTMQTARKSAPKPKKQLATTAARKTTTKPVDPFAFKTKQNYKLTGKSRTTYTEWIDLQESDYDFGDKLVAIIADWLDKDSDNELKFRKDTPNKRYNFQWKALAVLLQTTIFPSANNKYGLTPRDIEKLQKRPSVI